MREIKVKAWSPSKKEWRADWSISEYTEVLDLNKCKQDDDLILVLYTGLKDKNGVEVYEGDIVKRKWETGVAVVKFGEGLQGEPADGMYPYWGWYTDGWFESYAFGDGDLEVIGNIYENPELVK